MNQIELIRDAARQLVRELQVLDSRYCIEGFSFSECHLVTELQKLGAAPASELAEILVLEKSTISRLVGGLLDKGVVEASTDPKDRRRRLLRLTREGRARADRVHKFARRQVGSALDFVPSDKHGELQAGLGSYARALRYSRLSEGFLIRPIKPSDNNAVADIIRKVMTEFGAVGEGYSIEDPEVDDMHGAYSGERARFWIIENSGTLLGCGGFAPLSGGDGATCELRKMYFLNDCRGRGLGSRLLNLCLEEAHSAGFNQCYLETISAMTGARYLYEKHGFSSIDGPRGQTGHSACNSWMIRAIDNLK